MAKQVAAKWRNSASLIISSRRQGSRPKIFDYTVLLLNRSGNFSFMPNVAAFPGGVYELEDEAPLWLEHFQRFGLRDEHLNKLTCVGSALRPNIFTSSADGKGHLKREISLRITALREAFEEVGVFICRDRKSLADKSGYGQNKEDFDRSLWQRAVHNDPKQFLALCKELDVVPDLWSLHEWSVWLTPSTFKKRFQTVFYFVALQDEPSLVLEENEVTDHKWSSPSDHIKAYFNREQILPPPQFYELSRFMNISKLEDLLEFAKQRAAKGSLLLHPVQYKCIDGVVGLMPGDDMYPSDNPDACNAHIVVDRTMVDFRSGAKNLHRSEHLHANNSVFLLNFPLADGHLQPVDIKDFQ